MLDIFLHRRPLLKTLLFVYLNTAGNVFFEGPLSKEHFLNKIISELISSSFFNLKRLTDKFSQYQQKDYFCLCMKKCLSFDQQQHIHFDLILF